MATRVPFRRYDITAGVPAKPKRPSVAERMAREKRSPLSLIIISSFSLVVIAASMWLVNYGKRGGMGEAPTYLLDPPAHAPRPEVPAFVEDPAALGDIRDATLGEMRTLAEGPRDYLIHKMRSTNVGAEPLPADAATAVLIDELSLEREQFRGKVVHLTGVLDTYWTEPLQDGNRSGLTQVTMGVVELFNGHHFFFLAEDDPAPDELLQGELVDIYGYFMQQYYDAALQKEGPLVITRRALRSPTRPFHENEEVLERVSDNDEDKSINYVDGPGLYYLIHKAWATPAEELHAQVDEEVTVQHMFNAPESCRGKAVRIYGRIVKPFARKKLNPENASGICYVWEGQIGVTFKSQEVLVTINFLERPSIIDNCRVTFEGWFLQRWAYLPVSGGNARTITALVVGKAPVYHLPPGMQENGP